ncbi:MAG: type IX secretion system membrane protein PorP/SprF [Chlorobi bacterium]|nr:type IX secretion system membrane protein PorP/SprF [Chlorobiota bacterium]
MKIRKTDIRLSKYKYIVFFFFAIHFNTAITQDLNFSQFYNSPITLNPANTGNHLYNWRFINNYRTQWRSLENPYTTIAVSYDHQYYFYSQRLSWGVYFVNDKSGDGSMTSNKFYFSGSYHYEFKKYKIHGGIQVGLVQRSFSSQNLTFPDQFNIATGMYDPSLPTSVVPYTQNLLYPDINMGIDITRSAGRFEPRLGLAIYHLNNPKESFFKDNNRLKNRNVAYFGGKISITKKIYIEPWYVFLNHTKANAMLFGANLSLPFPKNNYRLSHFYTGAFARDGIGQETDAAIFTTGLKFNHFRLGISYDYNISELQTVTNNRGAFEISLIYLGPTFNLLNVTIPCDRY